MEGFTPQFFLQLLIAVGGIAGAYWAVRYKLEHLDERFKYHVETEHPAIESRAAAFQESTDKSVHELRTEIGTVGNKVAILEGRAQR